MDNSINTRHNLDFLSCDRDWYSIFKIGTCHGQWGCRGKNYFILSVMNDEPHNGHLEDVFQWFEHSCKRDGYNLLILEILNDSFYTHLTTKRNFIPLGEDGKNAIKVFNKKAYKEILMHGLDKLFATPLRG